MRRSGSASATTAIRFSVIVPVLSEQITVVDPSVSTAGSRRTSAPGARQAPESRRERDGRHRRQAFRDGRDGQADRGLEHQGDRFTLEDPDAGDQCADAETDGEQATAELFDLMLERGRALARQGDELADAAELGGEAGRGHDRRAGPRKHAGPEVHHVDPLGERRRRLEPGLRHLLHRRALSRQRCFIDLHRCAPDESPVGRHLCARLEDDDIAGNQLGRGKIRDPAVPADGRMGNGQGPEPGQRDAGPPFGTETDRRIQKERGQDRASLRTLAEQGRDDRRRQQQEDHEAAELIERQPPRGRLARLGHPVRSEELASAFCVRAREARVGIRVQELGDLVGPQRMPRQGARRHHLGARVRHREIRAARGTSRPRSGASPSW